MLRHNGSYKIYIVEFLQKEWIMATHFIRSNKIPFKLRQTHCDDNGIKTGYYYKSKGKEPFETFSASGKCWQETGIFGSFVLQQAWDMCKILRQYHPEQKFRVSSMLISQEITPIKEKYETLRT